MCKGVFLNFKINLHILLLIKLVILNTFLLNYKNHQQPKNETI